MPGIRQIEWEPALVPPLRNRAREARYRRETGRPASVVGFFEGSEWLCEASLRLMVQINTRVWIDPDLTDLVGLVVSQDNSCRFCFGAQRLFLRTLGMDEERIQQLDQSLRVRDLTERDRRALDFARRLSRSQPLLRPEDLGALAEVGIAREESIELAAHAALHTFFNRLSTFVALPPERVEAMPDRWWVRLLRPLLRRQVLRMRERGQPVEPLPPADAPFDGVVAVLGRLPLSRDLRAAIDGCFASRALSPHAAPLVFAVVARALGCEASEREASAWLERRGMGPATVKALLTNLSAPEASPLDERVATFARETVWYAPARIQRRCQALREELSREQLLDLIGAVALANAVCRLAFLAGCEPR